MSLITQCPACSTLFKVVPDQLRMSDGWVRCGQCDEVFDANANIRADVAVADAPLQVPASQSVAFPGGDAVDISVDVEGVAPVAVMESGSLDDVPHADAPTHVDPFLNKSPKELSDFSAAVSAASLNDELLTDANASDGTSERRYMQMFAPEAEAQADPKLSFMKPVRAPSMWTRRGVRVALALCCTLLAMLTALQVVVHERNRLAVQYPEFRSELAGLCTALGLEIEPLRQIESVVIDSSAFSKMRNEVYKLSFTLRNTSATALATPAMELTLTDMQDQVLMRKVLTPADFATVPAVMNAGVEVNASLPLSVRTPVSVERVSGYRLLAFYP
jgi:predicted Zn finger-like uncharacterized protein